MDHPSEDDDHIGPPVIHEHEEGGHGEPWLVSYADLMTLLFGFFVLMYAFAQASLDEYTNEDYMMMKKELAQYFGGKAPISPMDPLKDKIAEKLENNPSIKDSIQMTSNPNSLKIVITSQLLFDSGKSEVLPGAVLVINTMVEQIVADGKSNDIHIEGYTDDTPVRRNDGTTNWDLSAARAISVLKIFESKGVAPEHLQAIGFGENHPLAPNRDAEGNIIPENQAKNRRVVIKVIAPNIEPAISKPTTSEPPPGSAPSKE